MIKLNCFHCHKELQFQTQISRREECPHCRNDVHVCKNCQFYDAKAYNECREPQAEVCREKDRANFCDFFQPSTGPNSQTKKQQDLLAAAEALFKKKV